MNTKLTQIIKRIVPTLPLVFAIAVITAATHAMPSPQAAVSHDSTHAITTPAESSPTATVKPHVTVNGQSVPLDAAGNADLTLPGNAHVNVSGGRTTVTANPTPGSADVVTGTGNIDVSVQSVTTGGISHISLHISGSSVTTNGSSRSFTSTHVFSNDSA